MPISDLPLLSMLRTRMQWAQERQRILAENVANADTPGFKPHDLTQPKFDSNAVTGPARLALARTATAHITGALLGNTSFQLDSNVGSEVRPTGNAVNLEDEMMKVAQNQMDYQTATALYGRTLGLLKVAIGKK